MLRNGYDGSALRLLCLAVAIPCVAPARDASADELPIEVQRLSRPDSLRRVHLYDLPTKYVPEGAEIEFVGRYVKSTAMLSFCDPPWMHVTWMRKDSGIQQAFRVLPDPLPQEADDGAMFRVRGAIARNRPHLTYHQREHRKLHHFNLKVAELKSIEVTVSDEAAREIFAREMERAEPRLRRLCTKHELVYAGPLEATPNLSWYRGKIAVTATITKKPEYSRSPVPYATASVVIDPAGGKPVTLIVQRRIHQDPPD